MRALKHRIARPAPKPRVQAAAGGVDRSRTQGDEEEHNRTAAAQGSEGQSKVRQSQGNQLSALLLCP